MRAAVVFVAATLAACTNGGPTDTGDSGPEFVAPVISHTVGDAVVEGTDVTLAVGVTDDDGVGAVTAYFRTVGEPVFEPLSLEDQGGDQWSGVVPGAQVGAPGLEYYFKAVDENPDFQSTTYAPPERDRAPYLLPVTVVGRSLPFVEDFEGSGDLWGIGWSENADGFEGAPWMVAGDRSRSGERGALHRRGASGVDPMDDWLVSPPIDFTTEAAIEVTWWDWTQFADQAKHSLWISTTSPNPDQGGFTKVADVAAGPEAEWTRSPVVDLSAWAGNATVWLAWRYEGQYADIWTIDDVRVRALGPDLHVKGVTWAPDPASPGDRVTATVAIENQTAVDATGTTFTVDVDSARATATAPSATTIPGNATVGVPVVLDVASDHPDNAWLPFELGASVAGDTYAFDERIVVGQPSTAHVAIGTFGEGLVEVDVGVGDPDAPDLKIPAIVEYLTIGDYDWDIDLTDYWAFLPPEPGPNRWWIEVSSSSGGIVDAFEITYDGDTYTSDDLDRFDSELPLLVRLPRPPAPAVTGVSTVPSVVAPGDTATVIVTLQNQGFSTQGYTEATLIADDPDVTVVDGGPRLVSASGWGEGSTVALSYTIAVASEHYSSRPVRLTVELADEVESFDVPTEVAVPWPVLQVTGVRVDDFRDGDNDGLLDPDETAFLDIELANVGDLDSFGTVACTLSQTGGTASASFTVTSASFGVVRKKSTKSDDAFQLSATGAVGDTLSLALACSDSKTTYAATFEIALGEQPWLLVAPLNDAEGDVVDGYDFDFKNGAWRASDTTLDLVFESWTPYEPERLFIEMWGQSTGSKWTWYRLVVQGGTTGLKGTLQGYTSIDGFVELSYPTATVLDDHRVQVSIDIASMELSIDSFRAGFASGFCVSTYYCDHFPDAWGDPYHTGFYTSRWLDLAW